MNSVLSIEDSTREELFSDSIWSPPAKRFLSTIKRDDSSIEDERLSIKTTSETHKLTANRVENADSVPLGIITSAFGVYSVPSSGNKRYLIDMYGVVNNSPRATCECDDFKYRARQKEFDCKHVIALKNMIAKGYLPGIEERPEAWIKRKLTEIESFDFPNEISEKDVYKYTNYVRNNPLSSSFESLVWVIAMLIDFKKDIVSGSLDQVLSQNYTDYHRYKDISI